MSHINKGILPVTFLLAGFLLLQVKIGQAQNLTYSGSIQYATGTYIFEDETESISFTNSFGWVGELFSASFSVPFITQTSPWISYTGPGPLPTGGAQHQAVRDSSGGNNLPVELADTASYSKSNLGDPNLTANFGLWNSSTGASTFQLSTAMKIPFADPARDYGTGEWDFGAGLYASQRLDNYFLIMSAMKWWLGDMSDLRLNDPLTYRMTFGRTLGNGNWMISTTFSGYTRVIEGYDRPMNLGIDIGHYFSERASVFATTFAGLTESAADLSIGFGWEIKL